MYVALIIVIIIFIRSFVSFGKIYFTERTSQYNNNNNKNDTDNFICLFCLFRMFNCCYVYTIIYGCMCLQMCMLFVIWASIWLKNLREIWERCIVAPHKHNRKHHIYQLYLLCIINFQYLVSAPCTYTNFFLCHSSYSIHLIRLYVKVFGFG